MDAIRDGGLRQIYVSAMPTVTQANTDGPTVMTAGRGVDLLLQRGPKAPA